jgi:hypothetical protein
VEPVAWWFAPPLEFFVTAAFLVESFRSGVLPACFAGARVADDFVPAAGTVDFVADCLLLPGGVFVLAVFFVVGACAAPAGLPLGVLARGSFAVGTLAAAFLFALVFLALVFFSGGFLSVAFLALVFLAEADFAAGPLAGAVPVDSCVDSFVVEERLVAEEDLVPVLRAAARSVVRAGTGAPVAFLTAVFRAGMCPP